MAMKEQQLRRIDFGGAGRALATSSLALNRTIASLAADHAVAFPRQRAGRRDKAGPGQPSRPLNELVQLSGGDAAVARVQLGLGGRRGLIGRSRCPTRRCTARRQCKQKEQGLIKFLWAHEIRSAVKRRRWKGSGARGELSGRDVRRQSAWVDETLQ
jgi:hypothetical protein